MSAPRLRPKGGAPGKPSRGAGGKPNGYTIRLDKHGHIRSITLRMSTSGAELKAAMREGGLSDSEVMPK